MKNDSYSGNARRQPKLMSKICQLSPDDSILEALNKMAAVASSDPIPGLAYVTDNNILVGSLSDGDIRKLIGGMEFDNPLDELVKNVMNPDPVTVQADVALAVSHLEDSAHQRNVAGIFVVDAEGRFVDVIASADRIGGAEEMQVPSRIQTVFMYGLGFVGLTLSLHIARHGINAYGLDVDEDHVAQIKGGKVPFFEVSLNELLENQLGQILDPMSYQMLLYP